MRTMKPITPKEALKRRAEAFPPKVIEIFSNLIIKNLRDGDAYVTQDEALAAISAEMDVPEQQVIDKGWLDIEPLFEEAGWEVDYEKPGYNETGSAYFIFSPKSTLR
jgi:hypothetical protein